MAFLDPIDSAEVTQSELNALQAELDGHEANVTDAHNLTTRLGGKSDTGHGHTIPEITDLEQSLAIKADFDQLDNHVANVTDAHDLTTRLNAKANTTHTHVSADITDATALATPNTIPKRDASGSFANVNGTFSGVLTSGVVALVDGAAIATNAALGNTFTVTLGGNRTMAAPTNSVDGQKIIYAIKQDATGSRIIAWNNVFRFAGGVSPTLSTVAAKTDYIGFVYRSSESKWDCIAERIGF